MWLLLSVALGLFMHSYGNRINILFFPLLFMTAIGLMHVKNRISPYLFYLAIILYVLLFASFAHTYFTAYSEQTGNVFFDGFGEAVNYAMDSTTGPVCITGQTLMPHAYVLFFRQMHPDIS